MDAPWQNILVNLGTGLPIYLILGVGFVLAIVRWKEMPTASMILVILMPAWALLKICFVFLYAFLPGLISNGEFGNVRSVFRVLSLGHTIIDALAIGLLIWAIFAPRAAADPKSMPTKF